MKHIKLLLLLLLNLSILSCQKEELIVDEIIQNTDETIEQIDETVNENTTDPVDGTPETSEGVNQVYENGILVTKNSIFIDYSEGREQTFYTAGSKQYFNLNNTEYFLYGSDGWESFLLQRNNSKWELKSINSQTQISGSGISHVNDNKFIINGSGEHFWTDPSTWRDYIYEGTIENGEVTYEQLVDVPMYYRAPGYGDVTGNEKKDLVVSSWVFLNEGTTPYKPYFFGDVQPHGEVDPILNQYYDSSFNLIDDTEIARMRNLVLTSHVGNLFDGGRDEIIMCFVDVSDRVTEDDTRAPRGEIYIYEYDESKGQYVIVSEIPNTQEYGTETVESLQLHDVNNDGLTDIILEKPTGDPSLPQPFEIWVNNGNKSFSLLNRFNISDGGFGTFGWKLLDVNNDSYLDLILQPFNGGEGFIQNWCTSNCGDREQQGLPVKDGVKLHNGIYLNNGNGTFNKIQQEIVIQDTYVEWLKAFMRDGKLCYFGSVYKYIDGVTMEIELVDIELKDIF